MLNVKFGYRGKCDYKWCVYDVLWILMSVNVTSLIVSNIHLCSADINVDTFRKLNTNLTLVTSRQSYVARSTVECLQLCALQESCCGANVYKETKECVCLFDVDFMNNISESANDGRLYANENCENLFWQVSANNLRRTFSCHMLCYIMYELKLVSMITEHIFVGAI